MLTPECSQFFLGPSLLSTEALSQLHELLTNLPIQVDCDKAGLKSSPPEGVDETIAKATLPANESSTLQLASNNNSRQAAERTDRRSDGAINTRSRS